MFVVATDIGEEHVLGILCYRFVEEPIDTKKLMQVEEECSFSKTSLNSLRQIISCLYPGMLQTERFL